MSQALQDIPTDYSKQMVLELAAEMQPTEDIIARYDITPAVFKKLCLNPQFQVALKDAKTFWASDANAKERIRVKASALVEDSLLDIYAMIDSDDVHPSQRLEAFWKLAKVSRTSGDEKDSAEAGQRISVNINLGEGHGVNLSTEVGTGQVIDHDEEM